MNNKFAKPARQRPWLASPCRNRRALLPGIDDPHYRYAPHPNPLPLGEGVSLCALLRRPLSHGERDRVRGETYDYGSHFRDSGC